MKALIQKLVKSVGPSGYETAVRDLVRAEVEGLADEVRVDALGNLIARKGRRAASGLRIMLSAHMDEIGVIATHVDENGFVRFTTIGGVRPHTCMGGRVRFVNGVQGVIGAERLEDAVTIAHLRAAVYRRWRLPAAPIARSRWAMWPLSTAPSWIWATAWSPKAMDDRIAGRV